MEKEKIKGNSNKPNKRWKIAFIAGALLLCVLGVSLGIFFSGGQDIEVAQASYSVSVRDDSGAPIEEVYVTLCDQDGKEVSWLPYVTNTSGKLDINDDVGEGYYVKVVGVPTGFKLDESIKYTFDEKGEVKIVLTKDDSVYLAQIGDTKFSSFAAALSVANGSGKDTVIDLLADINIKEVAINNIYGNNVTINGNGKTITTEDGNNAITIKQNKGEVVFSNLNIKHKDTGSVFQITALANLSIKNVKIDATEGSAYNYCLINTLAKDGTTTLNLTGVDVKMAVGTVGRDDYAAIIRTGNNEKKTVDINMDNCNFDTTEAIGRHGIVVMKSVTANINIKNSSIKAGDGYAVWAVEQEIKQTITMTNSKCTSVKSPFSATPIKGYDAQIGNTLYLPLSYAFETACNAKSDVTLKFINDFTMKTATINNKNGKIVTIDGNGKTVTTKDSGNAFIVGNKVVFKNLTVNHKNTGSIFHATSVANITLTDVNMNATEGDTYSWALINLLAEGDGSTLDCTRVNATMAVESKGGDKYVGVIRTGNNGGKKSVKISLTDCNFDTTKATGRCGIAVMTDTKAVVQLKNTTIKTMDAFAIRSGKQDINWDNADTVLTSLSETYQNYPVEWYLAKIEDVFYTFEEATKVASARDTDTTINLVAGYTFGEVAINNKNGKMVTLNGNGETLTTSGGTNAFQVGNNVTFTNMTINHKNPGSAIQVNQAAGNVNLKNVTLNATEGSEYKWALINVLATGESTLNLDSVKVKMAVSGRGGDSNSAIIRTGNADAKTLNINLNNCDFDTTKATGRHGIVLMPKTTATINMSNTNIKTLDVPAVKSNETVLANTMTVTSCALDSLTKEYKKENEPVKGYQAKIGDVYYLTFAQALKTVAANDTVIEFTESFSTSGDGKLDIGDCAFNVIVDGKGKTLTATGGNNSFRIQPTQTGSVTLKNMIMVQRNKGAAVQVVAGRSSDVAVTLENMTIDATKPDTQYNYALVTLLPKNVTTTLNLKKVNVTMTDKYENAGNQQAIIRTGNDNDIKNVIINVEECDFNAAGASGRSAIRVMKDTTATITIDGSTIRTMKEAAVTAETGAKGTADIDDTNKLLAGKSDDVKGYKIKVGNIWYINFDMSTLISLLQNATEDMTVAVPENMTIDLNQLYNNNGKHLTIDTNGYVLTTTGTKNTNVTIKSDAEVIGATTVYYLGLDDVVDTANNATEDVVIKVHTDWELNLTNVCNVNGKKITIDMNGHNVTTSGTLAPNVTVLSETQYTVGTKSEYISFADALSKANAATANAKILLLQNVKVKENINIGNANGKTITLDGGGKTVTTENGNNAFLVSKDSTVEFKDMTIVHKNWGSAIQITTKTATVNLSNVTIDATTPSSNGYNWALINTTSGTAGSQIDLNMTDVTINMQAPAKTGNDNKAVIRTGNGGVNKTVNINLTRTTINASEAPERNGIIIMSGVTSNIVMVDSTIRTNSATYMKNTTVVTVLPIQDLSDKTVVTMSGTSAVGFKTVPSQEAAIGNKLYVTLEEALTAANVANGNKTVYLLKDASVDASYTFSNQSGANNTALTVEGLGHKVTGNKPTSGNTNTFVFQNGYKSSVEFKNMTIVPKSNGALFQVHNGVSTGFTLKITDVEINATTPAGRYDWSVINMLTANKTTNLVMKNVDVDMAGSAGGDSNTAFIRTGNNGDATTVNITMDGCDINTTAATKWHAISIMNKSTVAVTLNDTSIATASDAKVINRVKDGNTTSAIVEGTTVVINGTCNLKSGDVTELTSIITNIGNDKITMNPSVVPMSLEEEDTKQIVLDVPASLYDKLVNLIKEFADKWGWHTGL